MAATVRAVEIYAFKDLLLTQAGIQLDRKVVEQLIVEFNQWTFDEFNSGTRKQQPLEDYSGECD